MAEHTKRRPGAATQLQTFLIADVRGYTRYTHDHGDEEASTLAARFAAIVRQTAPDYDGELVELRGDEALCLFSSARQALRAAIELQRRLGESTLADKPFPLGVGIGLDLGEAVPTEGGYRGAALNLAARLCSLASPGQILVSDGIVHAAGRMAGVEARPLKPVRLKGLPHPVRPYEIVAGEPSVVAAPSHRRRRAALAGVIAAMALLGLGAAALLARRSTAHASANRTLATLLASRRDAVAVLDGASGKLLAAIPGPPGSSAMATTPAGVWLASTATESLYRFNPATRVEYRPIALGATPTDIAAGGNGQLWVAEGASRRFGFVRSGSSALVLYRTPYCCAGASSVADWSNVPILSDGAGLHRLDPQTGAIVETYLHKPVAYAGVGPDLTIWASDGWSHLLRIRPFNDTVIGNWQVRASNGQPGEPGQVIAADGRLWEVAPGKNAVLVLGGGRPLVRSIPVAGRPIAIAAGAGAIWTADSATGTVTRIDPAHERVTASYRIGGSPTGITVAGSKVWVSVQPTLAAPDAAGVIAYDQQDANFHTNIYTINADGSDRRQLTQSKVGDWSVAPTWSPDGRWIAFSAGPIDWNKLQGKPAGPATRMEIYVMHPDGSDIHMLTKPMPGPNNAVPPILWSPDGRHIAFFYGHSSPGGWGVGNVWVMNANGSDPHAITHSTKGDIGIYPDGWTADGSYVTYNKFINTETAATQPSPLYEATVSGRVVRHLPITPLDQAPFSGDGTRILFSKVAADGQRKIYMSDGNGMNEWLILGNPTQQWNVQPVWSPDQSRIAYSGSWETPTGLYVLRADGRGVTALVSGPTAGDPAWRPSP